MNINIRRRGIAAAALSLTLALSACGDQATLEPSAPSPSSAQATPRSSSALQVSPSSSAQPSQPSGDRVVPLPSQAGSASPSSQQTSGVFNPQPAVNEQNALSEYETIVNSVYQRNVDAVVNLSGGQSTGSGFVIDNQGHIVTNNHVVEGMQRIIITFADRSRSEAQLVGTFPKGDIAVVRAERLPAELEPVTLGDSSNVQIGQITVAIGSPLGLQQTTTSGIVSALNRSLEDLGDRDPESSLQGLIQTDASINPGNSGGPLFNSRGEVMGMNTLIATQNQGSVGLGFAVPVNRIKRVAQEILQTGQYRRPRLGISIAPAVPGIEQQLNLPPGVMIQSVEQGGPAEGAGLQGATEATRVQYGDQTIEYPTNGDIMVALDNTPIRNFADLRNALETEHSVGDTVTVTFLRNGQEQQTQLTLVE